MLQVSREELIEAYEQLVNGLDAIVSDLIDAKHTGQFSAALPSIEKAANRARSLTVLLRGMAF
jgi:hypothetical protein